MSKRVRRQQKVVILRRHLVDKVAVSDLCNEYKLQPSVFYHWLRQAMENLGAALGPATPNGADRRENELVAKVEKLEAWVADQPVCDLPHHQERRGRLTDSSV